MDALAELRTRLEEAATRWLTGAPAPARRLETGCGPVTGLSAAPDGRLLVVEAHSPDSAGMVAQAWDPEAGRLVATCRVAAPWLETWFDPGGTRVVVESVVRVYGDREHDASLWDPTADRLLARLTNERLELWFTPDARLLVGAGFWRTGGEDPAAADEVLIHDAASGGLLARHASWSAVPQQARVRAPRGPAARETSPHLARLGEPPLPTVFLTLPGGEGRAFACGRSDGVVTLHDPRPAPPRAR